MLSLSKRLSGTVPGVTAAAVGLLSDHLEAALRHCDAIAASNVELGASVSSGSSGRAILRQNKTVATLVSDLRALELSIALRLTQAGVVAERAGSLDRRYAPIVALISAGAAALTDAGTQIAQQQMDSSAFIYLADRAVIRREASTMPSEISVGDTFLVLGVMPLADVRAFIEGALTAIDQVG